LCEELAPGKKDAHFAQHLRARLAQSSRIGSHGGFHSFFLIAVANGVSALIDGQSEFFGEIALMFGLATIAFCVGAVLDRNGAGRHQADRY
jgi:hypothetical protein